MPTQPLRIATRGSTLARWQASWVAQALRSTSPGRPVELVTIATTGDRQQATRLSQLGAQGVFTREVQQALLDGRADVAVHSLKDLPTETVAGLALVAVPPRAPVEDVFVLPQPTPAGGAQRVQADSILGTLPQGARIGTGSLRRRAQLLWKRPDFVTQDVRGNVETRLRKLDDGEHDALILARAGLTRLGLHQRISAILTAAEMMPAVGQGAIGVECRSDDNHTREWLQRIDHAASHLCVIAERALLAELRGGCQAPVGALAHMNEHTLHLDAVVLSPDGTRRLFTEEEVNLTGISDLTVVDQHRETVGALGKGTAEALFQLGAEQLIALARHKDGD